MIPYAFKHAVDGTEIVFPLKQAASPTTICPKS